MKALLRRQEWARPGFLAKAGAVKFGPCEVDFTTGDCLERSGARERLTEKEAAILKLLMEGGEKAVSRDDIMRALWTSDEAPTARTIDNFVLRLRRMIEPDPANPRYLLSIRGTGYRFDPQPAT